MFVNHYGIFYVSKGKWTGPWRGYLWKTRKDAEDAAKDCKKETKQKVQIRRQVWQIMKEV